MRAKKAQATAVATLLILIALFILFYVLLIPPTERDILLGTSDDGRDFDDDGLLLPGKTLLSVSPGKVFSFEEGEIIKEINSITLFSKIDEETINLASTLTISSNFFTEDSRTLGFKIMDPNKVESAKFFFFIREAKGTLKVSLNNQIIFEGEVSQGDLPIALPVTFLLRTNEIKISVSRGFSTSTYTLRDIKLIVENKVESKLASRSFVLTEVERTALDRATLTYFINCQTLDLSKQGVLTLLLNDRLLFSDFVVCGGGLQRIDLPSSRLLSGSNNLDFRIDQGDYIIEDIELSLEVSERRAPSYSFEVDDPSYREIINRCYVECVDDCDIFCGNDNVCFTTCSDSCKQDCGISQVILSLRFSDDDRKRAAITINEFQININTFDVLYERDITDFINRGSNSIKIVPFNDFEIEHLGIFVD